MFWSPPQQPWHRPGDPFQLPQIHATVHMPSPSYILPPYHSTLTQSPSFPFLPHLAPAATHHFPRNNLYRERENTVFRNIHAATHLFQRNTLYRGRKQPLLQTDPQQTHPSEPRHTIFREITCVAKGERCFRKTAKPMSTVTLDRSRRTRFSMRIGGYRTADEHEEGLCRTSA